MTFDSGEPFGLPKGTVRGLIALAFTATVIQQTVAGVLDVSVFTSLAGAAIGSYFVGRSGDAAAEAALPEPALPPPSAGGSAA